MNLRFICILSIVLLAVTAFFSTGYYHFDEHFQILEFAGFKLKMCQETNLPWEYFCKMRPAIQPMIVVVLFKFLNLLGLNNPFTIALFLRLLSAAVSFLGMYLIYTAFCKTVPEGKLRKWFTLLSFFLWFMIFNNVRFSSENWSGSIFIIAFSLLILKQSGNRIFYLYVGLLLGLSFLFRYQTGILISGLILWHLFIKKSITNSIFMILGIFIFIGAGILIDKWYYGEWTLSTWNYFDQNILQHRAADFGVHPWWYYLEIIFIKGVPPFSLIIICSFIIVFIYLRNDLLTWTIFPFLFMHFLIGHKELRFLFPLIGFVPIVIIRSLEIIQKRWAETFSDKKAVTFCAKFCWGLNIILLAMIAFTPADNHISLYNKLYADYKEPATLYYTKDNPYNRGLDINFYKRANLTVIKLDSIDSIKSSSGSIRLFVTKYKRIADLIQRPKKVIYTTYPDWIYRFNFNNWIARTNCWYVYELD
jgi:phosphatidylinositol glycan class B